MAFVATISNDEASQLPVARFDGETIVVERDEQVEDACAYLGSYRLLGFDTETRPSFTPRVTNKVALLQLYGGSRCYMFRLNRIGLPKGVAKLLSDERIVKVGVAVHNDIVGLTQLRHFTARGFVDLQNEVERYGIENKSLRKIAGIVLGHKISKAQRLSNWEANVLTQQQVTYAATDAWACIEIYNRLNAVEPILKDSKNR